MLRIAKSKAVRLLDSLPQRLCLVKIPAQIWTLEKNKESAMHPRTEEVLSYLNQTESELRSAVDSVPAGARATKPAPEQWSVAQIIDHLAIAHNLVAALVARSIVEAQATGLGEETATASVLNTIPSARILDRTHKVPAPERIVPRSDIDVETAWSDFAEARERLRAAFLTGDGLALEQVIQPHPVLGPINMYQWVLFNGSHEARHTLQIREIADTFNSATSGSAQ
jgi:hypothetical protein